METQEEGLHAMPTSSEDDAVFVRGPVPALADPTPIARSALQARDVVLAGRPVFLCEEAQLLVPILPSHFAGNLSDADPSDWEWLWLMRRDVATHLRDDAFQGRLLHQPSERALSELIQLLEVLAADLR